MKRLWAPWRINYIRPDSKKKKGCFFCQAIRSQEDQKHLILVRGKYCFAILNLYPYNNGHTMVVPNRHLDSIEKMSSDERLDWLNVTERVIRVLKKNMKSHGFNVGMNLGRAAGAGVPGHLHLHIVPRWEGDHNFMPVLGSSKVISESLKSAYQILSKGLKRKK